MSKCRMCENPTEWNNRRNRPKLYCSKKCSNKWYHQKNYKPNKKNPDWGKKTRELNKRREEYKRLCETMFSISKAKETTGLSLNRIHYLTRELEIKTKQVTYSGSRSFWTKQQLDQIVAEHQRRQKIKAEQKANKNNPARKLRS